MIGGLRFGNAPLIVVNVHAMNALIGLSGRLDRAGMGYE